MVYLQTCNYLSRFTFLQYLKTNGLHKSLKQITQMSKLADQTISPNIL